jgi:hypothetical protein
MMKVYAVYKEGVKTFFKHRDVFRRLGFAELDGIIDISWQRNMREPEAVAIRRPIEPGDKVLLVEHSLVSGETVRNIARRIPGVNFIVAAEALDYFGAFFADYAIAEGGLKRVVDVADRHAVLEDGSEVRFNFGPDGFGMVLDGRESIDVRLKVVESYDRGHALIYRQNFAYSILVEKIMYRRSRLVADALGYHRIGAVGPYFAVENFRQRWSPTLARASLRVLHKLGRAEAPVMYAVEARGGVYAPIGFSPFYPIVYKLGLPAYIKRVDWLSVPEGEVLDVNEFLKIAEDVELEPEGREEGPARRIPAGYIAAAGGKAP